MNAYRRVMNTLQGLSVDRVPVFSVLGAYGAKLTKNSLQNLYSDAGAWVSGQQAVQETFGFDMILATFDYSAVAEAFGGEVAWFANQPPNLKRPLTTKPLDALKMPLPDPHHTRRLPEILSATRQLATRYREEVPLFAAIPGPGALPGLVLGLEAWMETLLFDEPVARQLLEYTGQFFVNWANALLEAGVTALVVTESFASAEITSRNLFAERLLPHVRAMFGLVKGPMVFHHGGGRILQILDLLPGLPGLVGVVVSSKDDLTKARGLIGPDLALLGNLDNLSLPEASSEEIHAQSLRCLQAAAPSGRYILSHSAADVPITTPPRNLLTMIAASEAYAAGQKNRL
ncbi:MAG: uroporphyrinogen decarboxylase family protein [Candidatus Riflebacteria bacterium]|nr:uroporphyrinogen decarboxylase family protein [Candidatus Riflebacteria bacterium]